MANLIVLAPRSLLVATLRAKLLILVSFLGALTWALTLNAALIVARYTWARPTASYSRVAVFLGAVGVTALLTGIIAFAIFRIVQNYWRSAWLVFVVGFTGSMLVVAFMSSKSLEIALEIFAQPIWQSCVGAISLAALIGAYSNSRRTPN